jgi:hypothetical protein
VLPGPAGPCSRRRMTSRCWRNCAAGCVAGWKREPRTGISMDGRCGRRRGPEACDRRGNRGPVRRKRRPGYSDGRPLFLAQAVILPCASAVFWCSFLAPSGTRLMRRLSRQSPSRPKRCLRTRLRRSLPSLERQPRWRFWLKPFYGSGCRKERSSFVRFGSSLKRLILQATA